LLQKIEILGVKITNCDDNDLIDLIDDAIINKKKLLISYANANSLNLACKSETFKNYLNNFAVVHPDGIGVYIASWFVNKSKKLKTRFSGSDFYPVLAEFSKGKNHKYFFFGHNENTLKKIKSNFSWLNIAGISEGYNFDADMIVRKINSLSPDILIVGLGQPLQEEFIAGNIDKINCNIIFAVGDGIRVFSGEMKRGPKFMRKAGMEWIIKLLLNPFKYWKRYIIGNPVFLCRIIRSKFTKFSG